MSSSYEDPEFSELCGLYHKIDRLAAENTELKRTREGLRNNLKREQELYESAEREVSRLQARVVELEKLVEQARSELIANECGHYTLLEAMEAALERSDDA